MKRVMFCAAAALSATARAQIHQSDVVLAADQGRIVTGAVDPLTGKAVFPQRVFSGEFGKFPNWTNDPGFDSQSGAFPPGMVIGFDFNRALRVWKNANFDTIPVERIEISKSGQTAKTPMGDGRTPGIPLGEANATGTFHHHPGYELLAPAADGVYLLEIILWASPMTLADSETLWIVFGQNADPGEHQKAIEWVLANLAGACKADLNGDGVLDLFDFLEFTNLFNAMDPRADFTGDGVFDLFDFLAFVNEFNQGCP